MHFCDETPVRFRAGKGGGGAVSFRREKFIAYGGPDGGDGGQGGSIVLRADANINTLSEFSAKKQFAATHGESGRSNQQHGKTAPDLVLPVPIGTMVWDAQKKKQLADLSFSGDTFVVAQGGRGGYGNAHFISSVRQAPDFAEKGEPGEERTVVLELKLISDVGLVGFPSVGKSTLISRISSARPKIAEYPFTTLVPNLGVVTMASFGGDLRDSFVVADLPGLIEGAHLGKGLGHEFLRHIARTEVLVHLVDVSREDIVRDYKMIREELRKFDRTLVKKPELIALNKCDLLQKEVITALSKKFRAKKVFPISAVSGMGLRELFFAVWKELSHIRQQQPVAQPTKAVTVLRPHLQTTERSWTVARTRHEGKRAFRVTGKRIEQIAVMTDATNEMALARVYDVMKKLGVERELRRRGAKPGDPVFIASLSLPFRG